MDVSGTNSFKYLVASRVIAYKMEPTDLVILWTQQKTVFCLGDILRNRIDWRRARKKNSFLKHKKSILTT
jgi:hypothetical protein